MAVRMRESWEDVEDYGPIVLITAWSTFGVTTFFVMLRVYCRTAFGRHLLGVDDIVAVFCLGVFLASAVLTSVACHFGMGKHQVRIAPADMPPARHWSLLVSAVSIWTFSLPKFSIVAMLRRILNPGTATTVLFWALVVTSQAQILATSVWWFCQCQPVSYLWDASLPGHCADFRILQGLYYFSAAYSVFLDLFFALYPIPQIMRLHMPLRDRLAVATAFGLSSCACMLSLYKLSIYPRLFVLLRTDGSYASAFLQILTLSEGCILLVCTSIPTLGPLFRRAKRGSAGRSVPTPEGQICPKSGKLEAQGRPSGGETPKRGPDPEWLSESTEELMSSSVPYASTGGRRDIRKTILIEQSISHS